MTRRRLFAQLAGALAIAAVDPERLLWTPGRKLISIPRACRDVYTPNVGYVYAPNDLVMISGIFWRITPDGILPYPHGWRCVVRAELSEPATRPRRALLPVDRSSGGGA